jgi:ABC-type sulfate transport system permease component
LASPSPARWANTARLFSSPAILPFQTEIAPTLVVMRLDQFDYTGAIAVALVLMIFSFVLLLTLNTLQGWAAKFQEP